MAGNALDKAACTRTLVVGGRQKTIYSLKVLEKTLGADLSRLPVSLKILLENLLRHHDGSGVSAQGIGAIAHWEPDKDYDIEIGFVPARVILQDFTGVPCLVDLAAMRDAMAKLGGDPARIEPLQPVDLVIDHSIIADEYGSPSSLRLNTVLDYERNGERYAFLRWGQNAFRKFRVVPPGTGIVHQVNLEYLGSVVFSGDNCEVYPDTVVGTDSHTPMVNGLGVLGWGVGGIEAEAAMLGQPITMLIPRVVGVRLVGKMRREVTATDLVLTVTQVLRKHGVVGKFVEFFGDGLGTLSVADRATIANMAPEYGATAGFFPVDRKTLEYLEFTGRPAGEIRLVEAYCKEQGMFLEAGTVQAHYSEILSINLADIEPSLAGPRRPQDRVPLKDSKRAFRTALVDYLKAGGGEELSDEAVRNWYAEGGQPRIRSSRKHTERDGLRKMVTVRNGSDEFLLGHGDVAIAAITSCTNTSNPSILMAAGLLARSAARRGLRSKPWVKTSLAPGSKVVTDYLVESGLMQDLEALGFYLVGYGCTTCIGNSGPLPEHISEAVAKENLVVCSVLSGNRNFEGRINPQTRANYLASPPLVVAYAIAGTMDIDLEEEPLGIDLDGKPVMLRDVWPSQDETDQFVEQFVKSDMFRKEYATVFDGDDEWTGLPAPRSDRFTWSAESTYIQNPPFFEAMELEPAPLRNIVGARVLAMLGDSVTTDHISPAGSIPASTPAGKYLIDKGVTPRLFNSYGARRGNHEVLMRGTFANIRLRNEMVPGTEGGWTVMLPQKEKMTIYDAAMCYKHDGVPLIVLAGKEYGSGSSRDWAAKGPALLGVKAVIAESYERIHRSNLIGMGVLPLQFEKGQSRQTLALTGCEVFEIHGIAEKLAPGKLLTVRAVDENGRATEFKAFARLDTPKEFEYYRSGGILQYVLRQILSRK